MVRQWHHSMCVGRVVRDHGLCFSVYEECKPCQVCELFPDPWLHFYDGLASLWDSYTLTETWKELFWRLFIARGYRGL